MKLSELVVGTEYAIRTSRYSEPDYAILVGFIGFRPKPVFAFPAYGDKWVPRTVPPNMVVGPAAEVRAERARIAASVEAKRRAIADEVVAELHTHLDAATRLAVAVFGADPFLVDKSIELAPLSKRGPYERLLAAVGKTVADLPPPPPEVWAKVTADANRRFGTRFPLAEG